MLVCQRTAENTGMWAGKYVGKNKVGILESM